MPPARRTMRKGTPQGLTSAPEAPSPAAPDAALAAASQRPPRERRERLSRAKVLRAGIELADAEGLDAVTMRQLADRLGVVPMALYKHVADKEDLIDGLVDTLIEAIPPAPAQPAERYADAVRESLLAARAELRRHPWARRAIETRTARTPAVLGHMERISALFLGAGFSPDLTHHVMHLLGNRIWGFSPELFPGAPAASSSAAAGPGADAAGGAADQGRVARRRTAVAPDPAHYPAIVAIAADARARRPDAVGCDEDFEFGFALDVLLDGIDRLHRAGWSSAM
jgi:AcrR family transcriptional regulator